MQIIAKVASYEITNKDLAREMGCGGTESQALKRLIDRCLILEKADQLNFSVSDEEFEISLMKILDEDEPLGLPSNLLQDLNAQEMELLIRRNIIIRKYVASLYPDNMPISEEHLQELYKEHLDSFCCEEMVRCSHILIKGEDALDRLIAIREKIQDADDFYKVCASCSDCPSIECCGDLGYFSRGKLFTEIEDVAFSLQPGEISKPFESPEGGHILMLTDRRCKCLLPFEDIKESLGSHLQQMEREYFLKRHLIDLNKEFQSQILILDDALK